MLLGIIRGLEALCDVIEYGPVEALQINTCVSPEAERDYRRIMANIEEPLSSSLPTDGIEKNVVIPEQNPDIEKTIFQKVNDGSLKRFEEFIDDIKANFSVESNDIDLSLIYDYSQLNAYGKILMDIISVNQNGGMADLNKEEQLEMAILLKERCQKGECDKYSFIFWALMVLIVDDTDKEKHLSLICDFSRFLGMDEEEMINIAKLIDTICQNK